MSTLFRETKSYQDHQLIKECGTVGSKNIKYYDGECWQADYFDGKVEYTDESRVNLDMMIDLNDEINELMAEKELGYLREWDIMNQQTI